MTRLCAAWGLLLGAFIMGCESPQAPEAEFGGLAFNNAGGRWTQMVIGGGRYTHSDRSLTEWISLNVRMDADGGVSGMYEYANEGAQGWRYHGEPDCLAISASGTRAVVIGPVTLSQGPDAPPLGTRVGFLIEDNGPGNDRTAVLFAGTRSCAFGLAVFDAIHKSDVNDGNFTIRRR